jgi:hypothetical protein
MITKFNLFAIVMVVIVDILSIKVWSLGMQLIDKALLFLFLISLHLLMCWVEYSRISAEEAIHT